MSNFKSNNLLKPGSVFPDHSQEHSLSYFPRFSGGFSLLMSAEACEKSSRWLWKESCVSTGVRKPGNTCVSPTAMI